MVKTIVSLALLLFSFVLGAQDFSGRAVYQTKMALKDFKTDSEEDDKKPALDAELMAQLKEAMNKASEKTYILDFTKEESLYTEEERLEQPQTGNNRISVSISHSTSGKLYKNLKENYSLLESDYLDKVFLIKDSLYTSGWELGTETKKVGNYTVYKATRTTKAKQLISEEENAAEKESDFLSLIADEPIDLVTTAWYTPEIPVANGPETYGGLPGLILELHTANRVYLCSEIVLNPKKPIKIKMPKGKSITQSDYDAMLKERMKNAKKTKSGSVIIETMSIGG
ncbi:MAG TPA: GLPGLI family protein [Flavobacterium sp.]|nr:GLPGLI family protein [Flavobacterium sp.]